MKLVNYYSPVQTEAASLTEARAGRGPSAPSSAASFDSILSAERSSVRASQDTRAAKERPSEKPSDGPKMDDKPVEKPKNDRPKAAEKSGKPAIKTESGKTERIAGNSSKSNEELAAEIADTLGVPVDAVLQALAALMLTPADLSIPENAIAFTQELLGVSSPAELLCAPGASAMVKSLLNWQPADVPEGETADVSALSTDAAFSDVDAAVVSKTQTGMETASQNAGEDKTPARLDTRNEDAPVQTAETAVAQESGAVAKPAAQTQDPVGSAFAAAPEKTVDDENPDNMLAIRADGTFNTVTDAQLSDVSRTVTQGRSSIETVEVVKQIVEQMKVEVKADTTELRLILKPESLGEVSLRISTQNGIVTAQFFAESQRVKEIIESQFNELKNALAEKGIEVADMSAFTGRDDGRQNEHQGGGGNHGYRVSSGRGRITELMRRGAPDASLTELAEDAPKEDGKANPLEVDITA